MNLTFTVQGATHEVPVAGSDELHELGCEMCAAILAACGELSPRSDLEAQVFDALLNVLVEQSDANLGEVTEGKQRPEESEVGAEQA